MRRGRAPRPPGNVDWHAAKAGDAVPAKVVAVENQGIGRSRYVRAIDARTAPGEGCWRGDAARRHAARYRAVRGVEFAIRAVEVRIDQRVGCDLRRVFQIGRVQVRGDWHLPARHAHSEIDARHIPGRSSDIDAVDGLLAGGCAEPAAPQGGGAGRVRLPGTLRSIALEKRRHLHRSAVVAAIDIGAVVSAWRATPNHRMRVGTMTQRQGCNQRKPPGDRRN